MVPGARGRGIWEMTTNGRGVSVWGDRKILELNGSNGCTTLLLHSFKRLKWSIFWYIYIYI